MSHLQGWNARANQAQGTARPDTEIKELSVREMPQQIPAAGGPLHFSDREDPQYHPDSAYSPYHNCDHLLFLEIGYSPVSVYGLIKSAASCIGCVHHRDGA